MKGFMAMLVVLLIAVTTVHAVTERFETAVTLGRDAQQRTCSTLFNDLTTDYGLLFEVPVDAKPSTDAWVYVDIVAEGVQDPAAGGVVVGLRNEHDLGFVGFERYGVAGGQGLGRAIQADFVLGNVLVAGSQATLGAITPAPVSGVQCTECATGVTSWQVAFQLSATSTSVHSSSSDYTVGPSGTFDYSFLDRNDWVHVAVHAVNGSAPINFRSIRVTYRESEANPTDVVLFSNTWHASALAAAATSGAAFNASLETHQCAQWVLAPAQTPAAKRAAKDVTARAVGDTLPVAIAFETPIALPTSLSDNQDYAIDVVLSAEPLSQPNDLFLGLSVDGRVVAAHRVSWERDTLSSGATSVTSSGGTFTVAGEAAPEFQQPGAGVVAASKETAERIDVRFDVQGRFFTPHNFRITTAAPEWYLQDGTFVRFDPTTGVPNPIPATPTVRAQLQDAISFEAGSLSVVVLVPPTQSVAVNYLSVQVKAAAFGCDGVDGSNTTLDLCEQCGGTNACLDCRDVPFGSAKMDACGVCEGKNDTCCVDRQGVANHVWDWLLLPYVIQDVSSRLDIVAHELESQCDTLPADCDVSERTQALNVTGQLHLNEEFGNGCLNAFEHMVCDMLTKFDDTVTKHRDLAIDCNAKFGALFDIPLSP